MSFSNILPDPVNKINDAGVYDNVSGTEGPGFVSTRLRSVSDTQVSRTISGRGVPRSNGSQYWEVDITYNKLTRDEFEPVYSFLLSRNGRKEAFWVALPEYAAPRSTAFANCVLDTNIYVDADALAGQSYMTIRHADIVGSPKPGDLFNIEDPTNVNHTKAYRVTKVETDTVYETSGLLPTQRRIHFTPPLTRTVRKGLPEMTSTLYGGNTIYIAGHGLEDGQLVRLTNGGTGLTVDRTYYVKYINDNSIAFSDTPGGPALVVSSNASIIASPTRVIFSNPKIRCIAKSDVQEYELNTEYLFNFSLSVEEIQP